MILLARVGDCFALLGFLVGLALWNKLGKPKRMLAAFMGISAATGLGQAYLRSMGMGSAWFGNLWDLSILIVLIPSLMVVMREQLRRLLRPLLIAAVVCWVIINFVFQEMGNFSDAASAGFYLLLAATGLLLLSQSMDEPLGLRQKPGFIRGVVCLSIGLVDALTTVTLSHPGALSHSNLVAIMSIRNAGWCGAYALLAYSLTLKRRTHGIVPKPEDRRTKGDAGGAIRERDLRVLHT